MFPSGIEIGYRLIEYLPARFFLLGIFFALAGIVSAAGIASSDSPPDLESSDSRSQTYYYTMRGEVRLLLFWLSRDGVGGGQISFSSRTKPNPNRKTELMEVLFGSNPDRIPGKINRWGYGKETATWVRNLPEEPFQLQESRFQGLMRHSEEDSLSQVLAGSSSQNSSGQFQYDATDSLVTWSEAHYEVRIFSDPREFHYLHPDWLLSRYETEIKKQSATRQRTLYPLRPPFSQPYGFLSGMLELIRQLLRIQDQDRRLLCASRPSLTYVFNAKLYRLEVQNIDISDHFSSPLSDKSSAAKVQFQVTNLVRKSRNQFWLFVDLNGEHSGIPFRIIHQPRWWLRIQLDLDPKRLPVRPPGELLRTTPLLGKSAMGKAGKQR